MTDVIYRISPRETNKTLNALFEATWVEHKAFDFVKVLSHSLLYVCAYVDSQLIGFVNVAWDGGIHTFLLDTTVHPDWQRQGIGVELVKRAASVAHERGIEWLHVDYEPHLEAFYRQCGFQHTSAGLMNLRRVLE